MRAIRYSRTFFLDLETLLSQGLDRFGVRVVAEKRDLVLAAITRTLRHFPVRPPDPALGIGVFRVARTPFVLLYDYDDAELRIYTVVHGRADRSSIDLTAIDWE